MLLATQLCKAAGLASSESFVHSAAALACTGCLALLAGHSETSACELGHCQAVLSWSPMQVVEFLKNPERFTAVGARIPKGVLLIGPPGTGVLPRSLMLACLASKRAAAAAAAGWLWAHLRHRASSACVEQVQAA